MFGVWASLGLAGGAVTLIGRDRWTPWWSTMLFGALLLAYALGSGMGRRAPPRAYVISALLTIPILVLLFMVVIGTQQIWLAHLAAAVMNVGYYRSGGPDDPYFDVMLFWPITILLVVGVAMTAREALMFRFEARISSPPER
jgi:hypothetical protein